MALGLGTDRPPDDSVRDVVDASSAVIRIVQNRPLFTAVLAGSFALHFFLLLLIVLVESAPPAKPDASVEIPVELVSASQADSGGVTGSAKAEPKGQNAQNSNQQAAKSSAKAGQQQAAHPESKPAQTASKPAQQTAEQKPPQPASAQKSAENKPRPPAKPPEASKPEPPKQAATQPQPSAKPANPPAEPPKQVAAAPQKPAAPPEPPKPSPATPSPAAQSPAAQTPPPQPTAPLVPPPTLAALPPPESPSEPGGSPLGLMSDDWHAVAVPKPSADGDEQLSYKTVVFGMLELNKRFPQDARARGASGSSTIYFELNDDGSVRSVRLLHSSGDTSLDVESLAIVMRSSPFPKPPRGAQKIFAATIEFNPNDR